MIPTWLLVLTFYAALLLFVSSFLPLKVERGPFFRSRIVLYVFTLGLIGPAFALFAVLRNFEKDGTVDRGRKPKGGA